VSALNGHHPETSRDTETWLTPPCILDALGPFDLDPCAAPEPRPWPTATTHITRPDDGLAHAWHGRVWLNPPYGRAIGDWIGKLADHGRGTALLFARTDVAWFSEHVWPRASALLFLRGRLKFHRADGAIPAGAANAGAPSVLIAYGEFDAEALRTCGLTGAYVPLVRFGVELGPAGGQPLVSDLEHVAEFDTAVDSGDEVRVGLHDPIVARMSR
jgi:hypothetical protein